MGSSSNFDQQRNRTASRNSLSYYWQLPMPTLPLRLRLKQRLIPHSFTPHITDILTPTDTDIMDIPMPIPMDIMPLLALFIPYMVDIHAVAGRKRREAEAEPEADAEADPSAWYYGYYGHPYRYGYYGGYYGLGYGYAGYYGHPYGYGYYGWGR